MNNKTTRSVTAAWREFLRLESTGGLILVFAAVLAVVLANSPLADFYLQVLKLNLTVMVENFGVSKPLILWINDGLMAIFFLLVGLELKREVVEGELSRLDQIMQNWTGLTPSQRERGIEHIWESDFPEKQSWMMAQMEGLGWSDWEEFIRDATFGAWVFRKPLVC